MCVRVCMTNFVIKQDFWSAQNCHSTPVFLQEAACLNIIDCSYYQGTPTFRTLFDKWVGSYQYVKARYPCLYINRPL